MFEKIDDCERRGLFLDQVMSADGDNFQWLVTIREPFLLQNAYLLSKLMDDN